MPGMCGLEVLEEIRRTWSSSMLPVLMVTAKGQDEDIVKALELGADDYITKPINYAVAAAGSNDGLWDWDLCQGTLYYSGRWKAIVGADEGKIGDEPSEWFDRIHSDDLPLVRQHLEAHLAGDTPHFECEYRMRHASGGFRGVLARGLALRDSKGAPVRIAGSQADVTTGKLLDPQTGLPNSILLHDRLERALQHEETISTNQSAVLVLDLDDFSVVNDSLGHCAGDELIKAVAHRLQASLRATDPIGRVGGEPMATAVQSWCTLARVGGDEFIVLLPDVKSLIDASRVVQRIQEVVARPFDIAGRQVFTTMSVGIASSCAESTSPQELLRDANTALHRSKTRGKGRVEIFDGTMREEIEQRLSLDTDLRFAHTREGFLPYYQAIVDLQTGRLAGFEALICWRHPARGIVSPGDFVPALEETGLILPVGRRFIEQVCGQMREWHDSYPNATRLSVSVNLALEQLLEDGLVAWLLGCLEAAGLSPAHIVVEVTESPPVRDASRTRPVLDTLIDAGIRVAMDDSGTGYSSLICLHELPVSAIKLDRQILEVDQHDAVLLRTAMTLANGLGLPVTAEGIETDAQRHLVAQMGCEFGQGYHLHRPAPAAEAAALIARDPTWPSTREAVLVTASHNIR